MKNIILNITATVALSLGIPALATPPIETSAFYLGMQAGIGGMDTKKLSNDALPKTLKYNHDTLREGVSGRIFCGYRWSIHSKFRTGFEVGYAIYPKNTYEFAFSEKNKVEKIKITFKGYYFDLLGVAQYNFTSYFSIIGKAGMAYIRQDTDGWLNLRYKSHKEQKILPKLVIGLSYDINNHCTLDLTYAVVFGKSVNLAKDNAKDDLASVKTLMLGANYRFA